MEAAPHLPAGGKGRCPMPPGLCVCVRARACVRVCVRAFEREREIEGRREGEGQRGG